MAFKDECSITQKVVMLYKFMPGIGLLILLTHRMPQKLESFLCC